MKRKWYNYPEDVPLDREDIHVWGPKIGLHTGWYTDENESFHYWAHDKYDINGVQKWMPFPLPPRKRK